MILQLCHQTAYRSIYRVYSTRRAFHSLSLIFAVEHVFPNILHLLSTNMLICRWTRLPQHRLQLQTGLTSPAISIEHPPSSVTQYQKSLVPNSHRKKVDITSMSRTLVHGVSPASFLLLDRTAESSTSSSNFDRSKAQGA